MRFSSRHQQPPLQGAAPNKENGCQPHTSSWAQRGICYTSPSLQTRTNVWKAHDSSSSSSSIVVNNDTLYMWTNPAKQSQLHQVITFVTVLLSQQLTWHGLCVRACVCKHGISLSYIFQHIFLRLTQSLSLRLREECEVTAIFVSLCMSICPHIWKTHCPDFR